MRRHRLAIFLLMAALAPSSAQMGRANLRVAEFFFEDSTIPMVMVVPTSRRRRSPFIIGSTCTSSLVPIARFKSVVARISSVRLGGSKSGFPTRFPVSPSALVNDGSKYVPMPTKPPLWASSTSFPPALRLVISVKMGS
jgi:hypothetical protein